MTIRSDKSNVISELCIMVAVLAMVILFIILGAFFSAAVTLISCSIIVISHHITISRVITMDISGCKIKIWKYERIYTWDEITIKRLEPPHLGLRMEYHDGGAFFSVLPVKKPKILDPTLYCMFFHPWSCVYVYFVNDIASQTISGRPGIYEVEKKSFLQQLALWGITLD